MRCYMKKIVLLLMCVFVLLCGCGKNEKPIIASTYTFEGEDLGRAIKLSIRTGNYCIRKGFETLDLSNSNDKFTVQVEKTQEYSAIFEDSLIKSFIFRSANRNEVKKENVIKIILY